MTIYTVQVSSDGSDEYVRSSARLRGISEVELLRRVMHHVLQDHLILSILDDEDDLPNAPVDEFGRLLNLVAGRRLTLDLRCQKFMELLRIRGRLSRQDFGSRDEITKWSVTIQRLVEIGAIVGLPAEPLTRIVYYVEPKPQSSVHSPRGSGAALSPSDDEATEDIPAFLPKRESEST